MIKIKFGLFLVLLAFATENQKDKVENSQSEGSREIQTEELPMVLVKIEEEEYTKRETSSKFIGVSYVKNRKLWSTQRRSKIDKRLIHNGNYHDEEKAARASDTLAKTLIANGETHELNFPDGDTEVFPKERETFSTFIGVYLDERLKKQWRAQRCSKIEKKTVYNGNYDNEETAARASDTLAKQLMANGEQNHKLNFPDDDTEVFPEEKKTSSKFIGVTHDKKLKKPWTAQRRSKIEKTMIRIGHYDDEKTAARASDTLAKKLIANGEQNHKLNFPDAQKEIKRKRAEDLEQFQNKSK